MRLSKKKSIAGGVFVLILGLAAFQVFNVHRSALRMLAETRARHEAKNRIAFEKKSLTPHLTNQIEILQNASGVRDVARYRDHFFAATGGGLVRFDEAGGRPKHFTAVDGLPESDLTALAVFQGKLFIGTRASDLVVYDGENFESYVFTERKIQTVTSLLEDGDGRLLVGTFDGGLIAFDGTEFTEIQADGRKIEKINCLATAGEKLFVGTFDGGLRVRERGLWRQFTRADDLPSNRVVGIAESGGRIYAATDLGAAFFDGERFQKLFDMPDASSAVSFGGRLFISKANGEVFTFEKSLKSFSAGTDLRNARLISGGDRLWLASDQGLTRIENGRNKPFGERGRDALTDNFVSALAFDARGNLWVGTFRGGIDVFGPEGRKLRHIEDDAVREINFLRSGETRVLAATSAGLVRFKPDLSAENITRGEGLPSDSITHFTGDFIATGKGLAVRENGRFRLISAVNGLPNNAVYATLETGGKLYAGTLGGLAEIEQGRVRRAFRDSNSNLDTNWVTALAETGGRIFIGTYGGGVFELFASGEIRSFEADAGRFVVNPNALYSDGRRLFAGTLDGVKILDLRSQEWKTLRRYLPSQTVMSIAADDSHIFFGTAGGIAKFRNDYFTGGETP